MAEYLVIRLPADDAALANWIAVDSDGRRRSPPVTGTLAEAVADIGSRDVIVLVPACDALTVSVDLPARGSRLLAALPYALEDQLADDVDTLHFAVGKRGEDGRLPVAIASHERMQHWLSALADAGIRPDRMLPENHGLAVVPNTLSLLVAEDQVMFNDGGYVAFVIQDVRPAEALAAAGVPGGATDATPRHLLVYAEPGAESRFENDFRVLRQELDSVAINLLPDGVLPRLAVTVATGAGINLLQGRYGEKTDVAEMFRPWRHAAMLVGGVLVLAFAARAVDLYRLNQEVEAAREQFIAEYREIRPDDAREVADPVGTVESLRRSVGGGVAAAPIFLPLLEALASAMAENEDVKIEAITYRAGVVDVRLSAPDIATLDNIQKGVSASNRFVASIETTGRSAEGLSSRIQIRESGV